jgi:hypothetical protein
MAGLKAAFAVLDSGGNAIGSARNLIATANGDLPIKLVCFGAGVVLCCVGSGAGAVARVWR